ncbi:MAG TPA: SgcJ/EcaC family oxidoreductase [Gemmataceae bacterium]|jgi:uncharacterized protein (TIGR02246 family)|nr:SgcJ/EcaC family oxidoreductase [Gemmataceae bacterium]
MRWQNIVPFTLIAFALLAGGAFTAAEDQTAKDAKRAQDRLALGQLTKAIIQAFDQRDAAAVAANWTEGGELIRNDSEAVRGRADIQKGYAEFFKTLKGKPKLEVLSDALRFPSADTAVTQATLRLKNEDGEIVAGGRQETVLVREDGRWRIAVVREWDQDVGLDLGLKDLQWLIGTWQAATPEREVTITYQWDESKAFIRGKFTVKEDGKVVESGTEMIGKDPAEGVICSWVFQSDGGFGGGDWARDGKKWRLNVHGVRADGKKLTGTILYIPVDPTTVTWQATNQVLDGVAAPDTQPIKVTKQKSAK